MWNQKIPILLGGEANKMTTLKQKFEEKAFLNWQIYIAIRLVKEWLQQKRKQFEKGDLILTDLGIIDNLLGELEQ